MSYAAYLAAISRSPVRCLWLTCDYCSNTFGSSPCTATGTPCYYTYSTCKDQANYVKGSHILKLCERDNAWVPDHLPLMTGFSFSSGQVDLHYSVTTRDNFEITLTDDLPLPYANPDKTITNADTKGTFWRNWLARNPNYYQRKAELYMTFADDPDKEFTLLWRGVIMQMDYDGGADTLTITLSDALKLTDKLTMSKTPDRCVTSGSWTSGTMKVLHGGSLNPNGGIIKTKNHANDTVFLTYTYTDVYSGTTYNLHGCSYVYGGSGTIDDATPIKQVCAWSRNSSYSPLNANTDGLTPDKVYLDLLCNKAGIPASNIETIDLGITLTGNIAAADSSIPVSDVTNLPQSGVVKIDDEFIIYTSISSLNLVTTGITIPTFPFSGGASPNTRGRGMFGTTAASHSSGAAVKITRLTYFSGPFEYSTGLYKYYETDPEKVQGLINQLCEQTLIQPFVNDAGLIDFFMIAPPNFAGMSIMGEIDTIQEGSVAFGDNPLLTLFTRNSIYYAPSQSNAGTDPANYTLCEAEWDLTREGPNGYNTISEKIVYANWLYHVADAQALAANYQLLYQDGLQSLTIETELKDIEHSVGEMVQIDSAKLVNADGSNANSTFLIVNKTLEAEVGKISYGLVKMPYLQDLPQGFSNLAYDYDSATAADKIAYAWFGDANNMLNDQPGYEF